MGSTAWSVIVTQSAIATHRPPVAFLQGSQSGCKLSHEPPVSSEGNGVGLRTAQGECRVGVQLGYRHLDRAA